MPEFFDDFLRFFEIFLNIFLALLPESITSHNPYPGSSTEGYGLWGCWLYWVNTAIMRWNRMLLKLASCLAIPAGILDLLDSQSPQEWPQVFVHRDHRDLPHSPPIDFHHFFSLSAFTNQIPSVFHCLLEFDQPSLEDLDWIFAHT